VFRPYIVGLGGTTREGSSTEKAISLALRAAASQGADTLLLCGSDIDLPAYVPGAPSNTKANRITAELGRADGIILGTPGYHGGLSGLVKNALDYTEDLRSNNRPYLEDRPVGCVVTAAGEQGAVTTRCSQVCGSCFAGLADALGRYNRHLRSGVRRCGQLHLSAN
jgi:FMN reductase